MSNVSLRLRFVKSGARSRSNACSRFVHEQGIEIQFQIATIKT